VIQGQWSSLNCCLLLPVTPRAPQAVYGVDAGPSDLRSISKAEAHFDSFNRHFPVARLTSKTPEVQQVGYRAAGLQQRGG